MDWQGALPAVDPSEVNFWQLRSLEHDEFSSALADGFEKAGDPPFVLHWAGIDLPLSSVYDLTSMADGFVDLGKWLCWPKGEQVFFLCEQGFDMKGTASLAGSTVEIKAEWTEAYRTPISSLADCVMIDRADLMREVGTLLRQLEVMLLAENQVYVPLSWVCRNLTERGAEVVSSS
jgi:hypothetical protein